MKEGINNIYVTQCCNSTYHTTEFTFIPGVLICDKCRKSCLLIEYIPPSEDEILAARRRLNS